MRTAFLLVLGSLLGLACGDDDTPADAGVSRDSGARDAGPEDAGGEPDAFVPDLGIDMGPPGSVGCVSGGGLDEGRGARVGYLSRDGGHVDAVHHVAAVDDARGAL